MGEKVRLIARREYFSRVRERSFRISTVVQLMFVVGLAFVPTIVQAFSDDDIDEVTVRVVDESGADVAGRLTPYLSEVEGAGDAGEAVKLEPAAISANVARAQVRDGDVDAALLVSRDGAGDLQFTYIGDDGMDALAQRTYAATAAVSLQDRLQRAGLSEAELNAAVSPPAFTVAAADPAEAAEDDGTSFARLTVANLAALLMYLAVLVYGIWVAQGVVEEKSSRIMEIMVNAATPRELMAGKVLGIGLAALTQLVPTIVLGGICFALQGWFAENVLGSDSGGMNIDFSAISIEAVSWFLVYFLLGFLLYAALYAGIGSLVSRQEEVNQATLPLTMTIMVGYFGAIFTLSVPDSLGARILSIFPLTSPVVMVSRVIVGDPAAWELALSIVLLVVAVVFALSLAARFYRSGVLMYGQKPSLRALFRPDVVTVAR
jgi:ABC-2 type transport system permease protein